MLVVSKYFTTAKCDMDESLTDFQEPKNSLRCIKDTCKRETRATRQKKKSKTKGQKDIRSVIQKNNELVQYTENFNAVCQQSGLDIDSEQLQIAIALSKSEQTCQEANTYKTETSKPLTSQERRKKITSTLLEYGFKVPEIRYNLNIHKKSRRFKKNSKLLIISEEERQQIISAKYAEILFESLNKTAQKIYVPANSTEIYSKATHADYELLKSNRFFIVDNLITESTNSLGSLLKDWSKIPGRPKSPILEGKKTSFSDIILTESELDAILSGTFAAIKTIVDDKWCLKTKMETSFHKSKCKNENTASIKNYTYRDTWKNISDDKIDLTKNYSNCDKLSVASTKSRSYSPDIFEDGSMCVIEDTPMKTISRTGEDKKNYMHTIDTKQKKNDESVDIFSQTCSQKSDDCILLTNKDENITKRFSANFMELTECVNYSILNNDSAKKFQTKHEKEDINSSDNNSGVYKTNPNCDIVHGMNNHSRIKMSDKVDRYSYSQRKSNDFMDITACVNQHSSHKHIEKIDLTKDNTIEDNVTIYENISLRNSPDDNGKMSTKSDIEDLPLIKISGKNKIEQESLQLTKESRSNSPVDQTNYKFDDFVYSHSDHNSSKEIEESDVAHLIIDNIDDKLKNGKESHIKNTSPKTSNLNMESITICNKIDYTPKINCHSEYLHNFSSKSDIVIVDDSRQDNKKKRLSFSISNNEELNLSQCSDYIFEISDEELDYSVHKSKYECSNEVMNELYDGHILTVNDNLVENKESDNNDGFKRFSITKNRKTVNSTFLNRSLSDSYLPMVEIKGTKAKSKSPIKEKSSKSANTTPIKEMKYNKEIVQTPKNTQYLIKTSEITPMLDYDNLSTPERNEELHKYGLKPFKRKRAVQILKHLYNQTHPVVENVSEEICSPSKKRKTHISPIRNISQSKKITSYFSTKKCVGQTEKGNIFAVTCNIPIIKEINCNPDDWVFQRRESVKVSTCKVPLHIAFHNYVSSRLNLHEAILKYQPVDIDVIHKELAGYGHKYDPKDLLRFLDKKCITVKTTDKNKNTD